MATEGLPHWGGPFLGPAETAEISRYLTDSVSEKLTKLGAFCNELYLQWLIDGMAETTAADSGLEEIITDKPGVLELIEAHNKHAQDDLVVGTKIVCGGLVSLLVIGEIIYHT